MASSEWHGKSIEQKAGTIIGVCIMIAVGIVVIAGVIVGGVVGISFVIEKVIL